MSDKEKERSSLITHPSQLIVRSASSIEAELLTAIHRECFPNYWNPDAFSDFFSIEGTCALIAQAAKPEGQKPVGMLVYRAQHEQGDIMTIAVLPHWRRQGIARLLLAEAMHATAFLGVKEMFLDVEEGNAAALSLYEQFGFTQINRRKLYYKQKDGSFTDALVMRCKLD